MSAETAPFGFEDFRGEAAARDLPADLAGTVRRLVDPAHAEETVHWGRNYLYRTSFEDARGATVRVVVKQFRNKGWRAVQERRLKGSKAERSWRMARAFQAAGIPTADPVLLIESTRRDGPSFFVTRHLGDVFEARYLFRAREAGTEAEEFPQVDYPAFLGRLGALLARMHDAGLFHRDLSIGNVLLRREAPDELFVIDLNRARLKKRLTLLERNRDLCRLRIFGRADQQAFLRGYYQAEGAVAGRRWLVYQALHRGFLCKIAAKKGFRAWWKMLSGPGDLLRRRRAHAHIPEAPDDAAARDKIVWDHLSDQPHQHASRWEKTRIRLADLPSHAGQWAHVFRALPGVARGYRRLARASFPPGLVWDGVGVAVRPWPDDPGALLAALDELGVRKVLLRLHPWQDEDRDELELARELHGRGYELAFALPQNRDLVRDVERWRQRVTELAELFVPFGRHFQVGQAINRSKWGLWTMGEYVRLLEVAAEALRRHPGTEILGPAVIDFEFHATIAALRACSHVGFDALASLLYVDRRGAPENEQLGFDTVGKVVLLRAIAERSPGLAAPRSWITEVNWPLWEGPHSPAGKSVSVSEQAQAEYLARFYLLALASGHVERVYWWQLVARGYGLAAPGDELRRRPSFDALATLARELEGVELRQKLAAPPGAFLLLFQRPDGHGVVAGWTVGDRVRVELPRPAVAVVELQGERSEAASASAELGPAVRYFHLEGDGS